MLEDYESEKKKSSENTQINIQQFPREIFHKILSLTGDPIYFFRFRQTNKNIRNNFLPYDENKSGLVKHYWKELYERDFSQKVPETYAGSIRDLYKNSSAERKEADSKTLTDEHRKLFNFIRSGDLPSIKLIKWQDLDPTSKYLSPKNSKFETAIHLCKKYHRQEILDEIYSDAIKTEKDEHLLIIWASICNQASKITKLKNTDLINKETNDNMTPLLYAAKYGNTEAVISLLKKGAKITESYITKNPIHEAIICKHSHIVKILINHPDFDQITDNMKSRLLTYAVASGVLETFQLLFEKMPKNVQLSSSYKSMMDMAIDSSYWSIAKYLASHGVTNSTKRSLLWIALKSQDISLANDLIAKDIDINLADINGTTPLHLASQNGDRQLVEKLLAKNVNPDSATIYGETPLIVAIKQNHSDIINSLLNAHADCFREDIYGHSAFHLAIETMELNLFKKLFAANKSQSLTWQDSKGRNLLVIASQCKSGGSLAIMNFLLENNIDVNRPDNEGNTAIFYATQCQTIALTQLLLNYPVNLLHTNASNENLLTHICERGNIACIDILCANGVDVNAADQNYYEPITIAIMRSQYFDTSELVNTLIKNGASIEVFYHNNVSLLQLAAQFSSAQIVKILVNAGADVNHVSLDGKTALCIAAEKAKADVVEILLEAGADIDQAFANKTVTPDSKHNNNSTENSSYSKDVAKTITLLRAWQIKNNDQSLTHKVIAILNLPCCDDSKKIQHEENLSACNDLILDLQDSNTGEAYNLLQQYSSIIDQDKYNFIMKHIFTTEVLQNLTTCNTMKI